MKRLLMIIVFLACLVASPIAAWNNYHSADNSRFGAYLKLYKSCFTTLFMIESKLIDSVQISTLKTLDLVDIAYETKNRRENR